MNTHFDKLGEELPQYTTLWRGLQGFLPGKRLLTSATQVLVLIGLVFHASAQPLIQCLKSFRGGGSDVVCRLMQGSDGMLYGTTQDGGINDYGLVFKVNTNGAGYSVLHHFNGIGGDGTHPQAGLVQGSDGMLYGTTANGGTNDHGTVFKLKTDGSGYSVLYRFTDTISDGSNPSAGLVQGTDGALYGTSYAGGTNNQGTVFRLNTDGSGYAMIHSFGGRTTVEGAHPRAALIQGSDGKLYGTTWGGAIYGSSPDGYGTVFRLSTDGTEYSVLYKFTGSGGDGANPYAELVQASDGAVYGTTTSGGNINSNDTSLGGNGTLFKLNTDGTGYIVIYKFSSSGAEGLNPYGGLMQGSDGMLYGTTGRVGSDPYGVVFKVSINGTSYTTLHRFSQYSGDGYQPQAGLVQGRDGTLYGTTEVGGAFGAGALFKLNPNGTGYALVFSVEGLGGRDGMNPQAGLVQELDGMLYGTANGGGSNGWGTVFKLNLDGTGYSVLHSFGSFGSSADDGAEPNGRLVQGSNGILYGTTYAGFINGALQGEGTVFKVSTNGLGYAVLHRFGQNDSDGTYPQAGLVQGSDGLLYGTTSQGGTNGVGTIFRLSTSGSGYAVLYNFGAQAEMIRASDGALYGTTGGAVFKLDTNGYAEIYRFGSVTNDGASPEAALIQGSDSALYGTTWDGGIRGAGALPGSSGGGTVFKLSTDGSGYRVLYRFSSVTNDGANPQAALVQGSDGMLYGTTLSGRAYSNGTVFRLNIDGTDYSVLHNFEGYTAGDGAQPLDGLVQGTDGALYGTTQLGGEWNLGEVFRLGAVPSPRLSQVARLADSNIELMLSGAPYVAWRIEGATNLSPPITWTSLATMTPTNGAAQFSDLGATNSLRRFYRAVWP